MMLRLLSVLLVMAALATVPSPVGAQQVSSDFTGDGKIDVAVHNRQTGEWYVGRSSGSAFGIELWAQSFGNRGASTEEIFVADFTGDGLADAAVHNLQTGEWFVGRSTGSAFAVELWASAFGNLGAAVEQVVVADFTGDGKADVAILNKQTGAWFVGISTGSTFVIQQFAAGFGNRGSAVEEVFVGNFNNDTSADVAIHDLATGDWYVGLSTGSSFAVSQFVAGFGNLGAAVERAFVGDFTGDGMTDVAIQNKQTGDWFIGQSTGSAFVVTPWVSNFGTLGTAVENVFVGDFNGDGKADVAIHNSDTGDWFVGRSTGSALVIEPFIANFGNRGRAVEEVFVGDFNNDGLTDVAVHNQGTGDWYVGLSTGVTFDITLWATNFGVNNATVEQVFAGQQVASTGISAAATAFERGSFLTSGDVNAAILGAAASLNSTSMVIVVVDRMGNPLGVFRKPNAPATVTGNFGTIVDANEFALSLARAGAFFSNNEAPLSSRTVRFISGIHFPPGIRGKPNAALYGIENTNRGCEFNATFNAGKTINPPKALNGLPCNSSDRRGCSLGIGTGKPNTFDTDGSAVNGGGVPIFKNGQVVGGIGVSGVSPDEAEYAALVGSVSPGSEFGPRPANPGAIYLDGIRLPFVVFTSQPRGTVPGTATGSYVFGPITTPLGADGVPEGYLIGPLGSAEISAAEVDRIVQQAIGQADVTRAAIRLPMGVPAKFVIAITDLAGNLLALYRQPDATIFSIDVSVSKARNVVYLSGPTAQPGDLPGVPIGTAVTNRTISFGAQPLYPPGIDGTAPGPFFQTFLNDVATPCSQGLQAPNLNQSGIVFFPGALPLYRNGQLIGGLGVSGDGVEQDDLVTAAGATGFVPPEGIRADRVFVRGIRLPLLKFPRNPEAGTRGD
jgi:uncharacterized protein GlcG (DUF336 family)